MWKVAKVANVKVSSRAVVDLVTCRLRWTVCCFTFPVHCVLSRVALRDPWAACGNQLCEFGEQCQDALCVGGGQCRVDCPFPPVRCPADTWYATGAPIPCSGRGQCNPGTGTCRCFRGYTGDACRRCDAKFSVVGSQCVLLPGTLVSDREPCCRSRVVEPASEVIVDGWAGAHWQLFGWSLVRQASCLDGRRNGNEEGVDCGGPNCVPCTRYFTVAVTVYEAVALLLTMSAPAAQTLGIQMGLGVSGAGEWGGLCS